MFFSGFIVISTGEPRMSSTNVSSDSNISTSNGFKSLVDCEQIHQNRQILRSMVPSDLALYPIHRKSNLTVLMDRHDVFFLVLNGLWQIEKKNSKEWNELH